MKKLILHLGGGLIERSNKGIELANQYPDVPILISSENLALEYYTERGIDKSRIFLDFSAWDTLTNFANTLKRVQEEFKVDTVYVVTHNFHMRRAMLIANAVYWRRGIRPIACPAGGDDSQEPFNIVRDDTIRAWIWRLTGILFYWKKVREERMKLGMGTPVRWNEIGL